MKNGGGSNPIGSAALNEGYSGFRPTGPETHKVNLPVYVHIDNAKMENQKEEESTLILRNRLFQRGVGKYSVNICRDEQNSEHQKQVTISKHIGGDQGRTSSNGSRHKRAGSAHDQSDGYYLPSLNNNQGTGGGGGTIITKSIGFHKRNQSSDRTANSRILKSTLAINQELTSSFSRAGKVHNISVNHEGDESAIAYQDEPSRIPAGNQKDVKQPSKISLHASKPLVVNKFRALNILPNIPNKGPQTAKDQTQRNELDLLLKEIDGDNDISKNMNRTGGGGVQRSKGYFDVHPAVPNILQEDLANSEQV
jgi:hypothetical protein